MFDRGRDLKPPGGITTNAFLRGTGPVPIMKFDFSGQVAIVTGAAGNLGVAVARAFRSAGAKLALIDLSSERFPNIFPDLANRPIVSSPRRQIAATLARSRRRLMRSTGVSGALTFSSTQSEATGRAPPYTKRRWAIGSSCSI